MVREAHVNDDTRAYGHSYDQIGHGHLDFELREILVLYISGSIMYQP